MHGQYTFLPLSHRRFSFTIALLILSCGLNPVALNAEDSNSFPATIIEPVPDDDRSRCPISIFGTAHDATGKPIPGVQISVTCPKSGKQTVIATTSTDALGQFHLADAPIILNSRQNLVLDGGEFRLSAFAKGKAIAWSGNRWYRHYERPEDKTNPKLFYIGEKIEIDLLFEDVEPFALKMQDEEGIPIANVQAQVLEVHEPAIEDITSSNNQGWNAVGFPPAQLSSSNSLPNGNLNLASLVDEYDFRIKLTHPNFVTQFAWISTNKRPRVERRKGKPVYHSGDTITLHRGSIIKAVVLLPDGKPASAAGLTWWNDDRCVTATLSDKGRCSLRLMPGNYNFSACPGPDHPVVLTKQELTVTNDPVQEMKIVFPKPAVLQLKLRHEDADSSMGLAGLSPGYSVQGTFNKIGKFTTIFSANRIAWNAKYERRDYHPVCFDESGNATILSNSTKSKLTVVNPNRIDSSTTSARYELVDGEVNIEHPLGKTTKATLLVKPLVLPKKKQATK